MTDELRAGTARFSIGQLLITARAMSQLCHGDLFVALRRHIRGDWGDISLDDQVANSQALREGTRLLSSYRSSKGVKFWIITEADRSATTVLLPEEY